jgi:hypothetical protein
MSNTYTITGYEPMCSCDEADRVCSITIRMHGQDETGKHTGYIDGILNLEDVKPLLSDIGTADKASELVNQYIADHGFKADIDRQIEQHKLKDVRPENFEAPEITLDFTVEPAVGSPVNRASGETPAEESSEEGEATDGEG